SWSFCSRGSEANRSSPAATCSVRDWLGREFSSRLSPGVCSLRVTTTSSRRLSGSSSSWLPSLVRPCWCAQSGSTAFDKARYRASGRVASAFWHADLGQDTLEQLVGLRPHHQVPVSDHVGRDAVDHQLFGLGAPGVEVITEPVRGDGRLHAARVDTRPSGHLAKHRYVRKDRKSTRLNSSHLVTSYAVFCLK